jgi:FKBP-type peptidyl-prolyl cis-trans isomerase
MRFALPRDAWPTRAGVLTLWLLLLLILPGCAGAPQLSADATLDQMTFGLEAEVDIAEMQRHPRGFWYREIIEGDGTPARAGRHVEIAYVVRLADGREMDRAEMERPLRFRIGDKSMIPALDAAVREMREGGARQLVVPPRLGYGARRAGPVPPNSVLVMVVQLVRVE